MRSGGSIGQEGGEIEAVVPMRSSIATDSEAAQSGTYAYLGSFADSASKGGPVIRRFDGREGPEVPFEMCTGLP